MGLLHTLLPNAALSALLLGASSLALAAGSFAGCSSDDTLPLDASSGSGTTTQTGDNRGAELFAALQADLLAACDACHKAGGIADTPFLAGPDVYMSVTSWPGIITQDPAKSTFLTHAISGAGHSGTNLDSDSLKDTLLPAIEAWLEEEARGIVDGEEELGPSIEPITPILGFNAVYLDSLGPEFAGMAITFNADTLTTTLLQLSELQIHATSDSGVHYSHPLFVVYPKGLEADPDPTDSFSNFEDRVGIGESETLGPGTLILTNWQNGAKLSVAFELIEPLGGGGGEGGGGSGTGGCVAVDLFTANAQGPLQNNCAGCHGGNNGQATSALDMSDLQGDPASACAQVKNRVSPGDPPSSQIFITTDPGGNAAHPFKFGGDANAWNAFRESTSNWITAEQ